MDSSTLAFFAARALKDRKVEEEEAEEAEELRQLDQQAATAEGRLLEELQLLQDASLQPAWASLSPIEQAAVQWYAAKLRISRRREKRRRTRRRTTRRTRRVRSRWLARQPGGSGSLFS